MTFILNDPTAIMNLNERILDAVWYQFSYCRKHHNFHFTFRNLKLLKTLSNLISERYIKLLCIHTTYLPILLSGWWSWHKLVLVICNVSYVDCVGYLGGDGGPTVSWRRYIVLYSQNFIEIYKIGQNSGT